MWRQAAHDVNVGMAKNVRVIGLHAKLIASQHMRASQEYQSTMSANKAKVGSESISSNSRYQCGRGQVTHILLVGLT